MTALYYALTVVFSATQSVFTKRNGKTESSITLFMLTRSVAALALFSLFLIGGTDFEKETLIFGAIFGIGLCLATFTGYSALISGPMGLTSALVSFSLVVPLVYGLICGEKLSAFGIVGLVLIAVSVVLITRKKGEGKANVSLKWILFTAATTIINGVCSIVQKYHQSVTNGGRAEFMWTAMAVSTVVFAIAFFVLPKKGGGIKDCLVNGSVSGAANGLAGFLTLTLSAVQNAAVLFPIISVTNLASALICGRLFFKEKISKLQLVGVITSAAAIVLLQI